MDGLGEEEGGMEKTNSWIIMQIFTVSDAKNQTKGFKCIRPRYGLESITSYFMGLSAYTGTMYSRQQQEPDL